MKLKIAILGTRGIPNHYGGYEQAVTYLSEGLVKKGHFITVYNSTNHPYQQKNWHGVEIVHCKDPEQRLGTAGQFIYDWNCITDARKKNFDLVLMMGYTSSSIWGKWFPKKAIIISNMDGLEWKRSKYSKPVQHFLRYAEKLAVRFSDFHIADSPVIKDYLDNKYTINSHYIPYGAEIPATVTSDFLIKFNIQPDKYHLLIARIEPENNIEPILDGFLESGCTKKILVIGNTNNKYGRKLKEKYIAVKKICFTEAIFDQTILQNLRKFCSLYFHGHSVGGTNPSLLEAMAAGVLIAAHKNVFNESILGKDAKYFSSTTDVALIINTKISEEEKKKVVENNLEKIKTSYNWQTIVEQYESFILSCYSAMKK